MRPWPSTGLPWLSRAEATWTPWLRSRRPWCRGRLARAGLSRGPISGLSKRGCFCSVLLVASAPVSVGDAAATVVFTAPCCLSRCPMRSLFCFQPCCTSSLFTAARHACSCRGSASSREWGSLPWSPARAGTPVDAASCCSCRSRCSGCTTCCPSLQCSFRWVSRNALPVNTVHSTVTARFYAPRIPATTHREDRRTMFYSIQTCLVIRWA